MKKINKEKEVKATPESKVAEISKEIVKVEKEASNIVVKTESDYKKASVFLSSVVKPRANRITELVKFFTEPFVEARRVALVNKKEVETMFEKQVKSLSKVERDIKQAMGSYLKIQAEKEKKEEDRLQKIRDDANKKREEKGQDIITEPIKTVEKMDTMVKNTEGGKTVAKRVWKFEIENETLVITDKDFIKELLEISLKKGLYDQVVRSMVLRGVREIKGVKIYEDFDISASA